MLGSPCVNMAESAAEREGGAQEREETFNKSAIEVHGSSDARDDLSTSSSHEGSARFRSAIYVKHLQYDKDQLRDRYHFGLETGRE